MHEIEKNLRFKNDERQKWLLLALLLLLILPFPVAFFPNRFELFFAISFSLLLLTSVYSISASKIHFRLLITIGLASFVFLWIGFFNSTNFITWAKLSCLLVFFSYLAIQLFRKIAKNTKVSIDIILASISGYLIIGVLGGLLFSILEHSFPNSFKSMPENLEIYELLYFSFITLTSVGFGDISPNTNAAKSLTLLLAIAGQLYLTILIAILVGKYLSKRK